MKNKILVLILSTNEIIYNSLKIAQSETWVKYAEEKGIICIFYSGSNNPDILINNNLNLYCDDRIESSGIKLIKALQYIEQSNFDYTHIYRTNLSSFIYIDDFIEFINKLPVNYYGGYIESVSSILSLQNIISFFYNKYFKSRLNTILFASGSGFFLSKNLVKSITSSKKLNFNFLDDVMVGIFFKNLVIQHIARYNMFDTDQKCKDIHSFHIRIKSENREFDALLMYQLNKFNNLKAYLSSNL